MGPLQTKMLQSFFGGSNPQSNYQKDYSEANLIQNFVASHLKILIPLSPREVPMTDQH